MAITAKYACDLLSEKIPLTPNYDDQKTSYISAYGVFDSIKGKKVIIRAADHGTYLFHWIDRNKEIDLSQSANIAITFKDTIDIVHNTTILDISARVFVVKQYVYDCSKLEQDDVDAIYQAVMKLVAEGAYSDPFIGTTKHSFIWKEESNTKPKDITKKVAKQKRRRERRKRLRSKPYITDKQ